MHRSLLLAIALTTASAAYAAPDVTGDWIVQDRSGVVTIERCGASICGRVGKALIIKPNYPKTDIHNPNAALRSKPILGLQILSGFTAKDDRWADGKIYDPESGKTYKSNVRLNADGSLRVSGCIAFFCQSQRWTRK